MQTSLGAFHPTRFGDIAVTVDFHCNSACRFCIVQEGMNRYEGVPFERFARMVEQNARDGRHERVIFTGGEVTLTRNLPRYVRFARDHGRFKWLRLQTNGRRLEDPAVVASLVDDGLNEYFVSIHGHDASSHDDITQRPGSFDELIRALQNLKEHPVRVLTNTVMTKRNLASIPRIVDVVHALGVRQMEFWNYLPMEDQQDERDLIAPMETLMPALRQALERCAERGIEASTKYVPHCLLGDHSATLDNSQPDVVIVESFWDQFPKFSCLYEGVCEHSDRCLGLHHPYVNKYGWEENRLRRTARTRPWVERKEPGDHGVDGRAPASTESDEASNPWRALVAGAVAPDAATLTQLHLTRNEARYRYQTASGASFEVVLSARHETRPAFVRTAGFNVEYTNVRDAETEDRKQELRSLIGQIAITIRERDTGSLTLDPTRGVQQVVPPRGRKRESAP